MTDQQGPTGPRDDAPHLRGVAVAAYMLLNQLDAQRIALCDRHGADEVNILRDRLTALATFYEEAATPLDAGPVEGEVRSACPGCGHVDTRRPYDVGSGPELSCAECEWCWGALGQGLGPIHPPSYRPGGPS